ncbi:MAG TPA: CooT family nickel-binding protein [Archaeoglobus sp.]|nr:CooT family nickel-binding protein [Archaeoglobus sp.]
MCESKVFLKDREDVLMEDVVKIVVDGDKVKMWDILGNYKEVEGKVVEMDLIGHKILLEGCNDS